MEVARIDRASTSKSPRVAVTRADLCGLLIPMMTSTATQSSRATTADPGITSSLGDGRQRFLAQVVAHGLSSGRRSAKDFLRHFSPKAIMLALESQPRLRANIVVPTIGLHEKVALKKSAAALGEDLQIALDEHVVDEEAIVRLFDADDRVRFLDDKKLWAFVAEGDFWRATSAQAGELAIAKQHLAYIVDSARANGLVTDHDVVEGLTLERILEALPKDELVRVAHAAVSGGRHGRPFDDEKLLGVVSTSTLLDHVPLAQMWESVVVPRIAVAHGFADRGFVAGGAAVVPPPLPSAVADDVDEIVVEVVDRDSSVDKLPAKAQKSRRIGALDLSELKSEIGDEKAPKS